MMELFNNLNMERAYEIALKIPEMDEIEISALLTALELKGYTPEVIAGFCRAVLDRINLDLGEVFDTCGTGGDFANTINASTAVAIATSIFAPVAKHGNRAVSSKSGSADVLEKLGIKIDCNANEAKKMIQETNFVFLYAPLYHKSFAKVSKVRKKLKMKTIFNILGPLVNPANPKKQIVGVSSEKDLYKVAEAMVLINRRGIVVYGSGIDEVNPNGETVVLLVKKEVEKIKLSPEDFGLKKSRIIPCSSSEESAFRVRAVLSGKGTEEDTNFIAINFATALLALGYEDLKENVEIFFENVENQSFIRKLEEIVCASKSL